ncbi:hypothetical protein EDD25_0601 [Cryobacterium psychrophilum]|nr:hypothetical protein EDD25_0601 [Cryobacterium psychrophilum]
MNECRRYAIHFDWIPGHSQNGPVGIWNEDGECHYPVSTGALQAKGAQSFADRGNAHTYETWLAMREETTSTYGANWSPIDTNQPMEVVIESMVAEFLAVEHPTLTHVADVPDIHDAEDVDEPAPVVAPATPAMRRIISESWWIASELATRHPEHLIWEMHPGGGMYDCLALWKPGEDPSVQLNRAGSLHVLTSTDFHLSWSDVLADQSPHGPVKAIEEAARLTLGGSRPSSTRRTLAYRFIATLLRLQLHDRHTWDARNEFLDSVWNHDNLRGYLGRFPAAAEAARTAPEIGLPGEPQSHFWAILRDEEPVAIISIDGVLYRDSGTFDLMAEYQAVGRSITHVVAKCAGDWLH